MSGLVGNSRRHILSCRGSVMYFFKCRVFLLQYYSAGSAGLPVSVQCVGLPYQEELVLRLMKELEDAIKK